MNTKVLFIAAAMSLVAGSIYITQDPRETDNVATRQYYNNVALEFSQNDVNKVLADTLDKQERILALRRIHHTAVSNMFSLEQLGLTEDGFERLMEELILTDEVTRQEAGVKLRNE